MNKIKPKKELIQKVPSILQLPKYSISRAKNNGIKETVNKKKNKKRKFAETKGKQRYLLFCNYSSVS